jgi:hypothetical protein
MRKIRTVLLLAALLAGCQQPGQGTGVQSATLREDEKLHFFEPEFAAVLDQVVDHLGQACAPSATNEDRLNACLRDQFAEAFDDSRQGRRECDFHSEVSDFVSCVTIGNSLIDIRHRLSDDRPVTSAFWHEEDAMVDALTDTIVERGVDRCGSSGPAERIQACVMSWFEQEVALPAGLAGRCEGQSDDKARYVCFVEGVMVRYLQDHVSRLGAIST